jgi:predicted ester cyclase
MSVDARKELVRRFIEEVINEGNLAIVGDLVAPGFVDHHPSGRTAAGVDAVIDAVTANRLAFPDWHETIEDLVAEGEMVVVRATARATHKGVFMDIAPTGRPVTLVGIDIFRIADDQLVEHWGIGDLLGLLQQLDAVPNPGRNAG